MSGKIEEIQGIIVKSESKVSLADIPTEEKYEVRDKIIERIRRIAGEDSIKRVVPIHHQGDHKTQDIMFDMDNDSFIASIRYNNALTEGWVNTIEKYPKKC